MKRTSLVLLLLFISAGIYAQAPINRGERQLNTGIGFAGWGIPIYAGMDFGLVQDFSAGFKASYYTENSDFAGYGLLDYHFNRLLNIPSQCNAYLGAGVGYVFTNANGLYFNLHAGGRYFFTDDFGINLEFGGGVAGAGNIIGITYKF